MNLLTNGVCFGCALLLGLLLLIAPARGQQFTIDQVVSFAENNLDGRVFAGTRGDGLYYSDDGVDFIKSGSLDGQTVTAIASNPFGTRVYAGTPTALYVSTDNGQSFVIDPTAPRVAYNDLVLAEDGLVYAATSDGLYRLTSTWNPAGLNGRNLSLSAIAFNDDGDIFLGTPGIEGIFRSTDDLATFVELTAGLDAFARQVNDLAFADNGLDERLLVGSDTPFVYYSDNDGASFVRSQTQLGPQTAIVMSVAAERGDNFVYAGTNLGGLFRSDDGGAFVQIGIADAQQVNALLIKNRFAVDPAGGDLFAGTGRGVRTSFDSGTTFGGDPDSPLINTFVRSLATDDDDNVYAGTQNKGIFFSSDDGMNFVELNAGIPPNAYVHAIEYDEDEDALYAAIHNLGLYRLDQGDTTWRRVESPDLLIYDLAYNENDGRTYAAGAFGLSRTTDDGERFEAIDTIDALDTATVLSIEASDDGTLVAGTAHLGAFISTDGLHWTRFNAGLPGALPPITAIAYFDQEDQFYAGTNSFGAFTLADDFGSAWTPITAVDNGGNVNIRQTFRSFDVEARGDAVFFATPFGLLTTEGLNDDGIVPVGGTFSDRAYYALAVDDDDRLYAGAGGNFNLVDAQGRLSAQRLASQNRGQGQVFTIASGTSTLQPTGFDKAEVVANEAATPSEALGLGAAYPNPFARTATIPFTLAQSASVRLVVYDVLGREVAVLFDGQAEAGPQAVAFDAAGLAGGVYVYRLTVDGATESKRVVLLK